MTEGQLIQMKEESTDVVVVITRYFPMTANDQECQAEEYMRVF